MDVPEFLSYSSSQSELIKSFILEFPLSLTWCQKNAPNYQENDGFLKNFSRL